MAPPRLPQAFVERLVGVLAAIPAVAAQGVAGRQAFLVQIRADGHRISGFDPRQAPRDFATILLATAANVVPFYDGPRRGWPALGEILAVLLADPALAAEDRDWIAALCVRYKLIPTDRTEAEVPAATRAILAAVPPQPAPYWEGGMFPPAMQREMQYGWLQQAVAAGNWEGVGGLAQAVAASLDVPELGEVVRAELAARGLDLPALIARAEAELGR